MTDTIVAAPAAAPAPSAVVPPPAPGAAPAPAPAAVAPPPAPASIAQGGAPEDTTAAPTPGMDWPTLRSEWAAGDEALAKVLDRYQDGAAFAKAHKQLQDKIASGELRASKKLPDNPTPEQLAEYRKANGVPEAPDGYDIQFPVGFAPDDATKATLEEYRAYAHEHNIPANFVKGQVQWYLAAQQKAAEKLASDDASHQSAGAEELRKDWGFEFQRNIQTVQTLFEGDEDLFSTVMGARGPDGRKLGNNPAVLKFLVDIGVQANPTIREYAGDGSVTPRGAAERIQEIEALARNDFARYKAPEIQEEYRRLLTYQEARGNKVA